MSTQPDPDLDNLLSYVESESWVIHFKEVKETHILGFFSDNNLALINLI
jgi:hypothetical protein